MTKIKSLTVLNNGMRYIIPSYIQVTGKTATGASDHTTLPFWYNLVDTGAKLYGAAKMLSGEVREIFSDRWGTIAYDQNATSNITYDADSTTGSDVAYAGNRALELTAGEQAIWKFDNYYPLRQSPTITITRANSDATLTYSLDGTTYTSSLPDATGKRYVYAKAVYNTVTEYITRVKYDAVLDTGAAVWFSIGLGSATIWHDTDSGTNQADWNVFYRERL